MKQCSRLWMDIVEIVAFESIVDAHAYLISTFDWNNRPSAIEIAIEMSFLFALMLSIVALLLQPCSATSMKWIGCNPMKLTETGLNDPEERQNCWKNGFDNDICMKCRNARIQIDESGWNDIRHVYNVRNHCLKCIEMPKSASACELRVWFWWVWSGTTA